MNINNLPKLEKDTLRNKHKCDLRNISKKEAIQRAKKLGLEKEVEQSIKSGTTPYEALIEWNA